MKPVTPDVFVELFTMCLSWEWERAVKRYEATRDNNYPRYPHMDGWSTVDKVVRILHGLGILTNKQRLLLHKDRRTQSLILRNSSVVATVKNNELYLTTKQLVAQQDLAQDINREKMLRNMRFFVYSKGRLVATKLAVKYAEIISCTTYFTEIERQNALLSDKAKAPVMNNYHQRVEEETR